MSVQPLTVPALSGVLRVDRYFSYLRVADPAGGHREYLLLLHNSPAGVVDLETADYTTSYLLHDLGKSAGSPLTVWGFEGAVGSTATVAIVRAQ